MHNHHATQCTTSANMHSHIGEGCFSEEKKKFYKDVNQTENFTGAKTENNILPPSHNISKKNSFSLS